MSTEKSSNVSRRKFIAAAGATAAALVAGGVGYYAWTTTQAPPKTEEFSLGALLSLTGTMADVAKTQRDGILLAVKEINTAGGVNVQGTKMNISVTVQDDESNTDVGVRRFREMIQLNHIRAVIGTSYAPMVMAMNEQSKTTVPYVATCGIPSSSLKKGTVSSRTFVTMGSNYAIGYCAAAYAISKLGLKRIYFLARSDSWGWDMETGVNAAAKALGGQVIGRDEAPLGAPDFTPYLIKVLNASPDVFLFSQFAGDQTNVLKQAYAMGLGKSMKLFAAWLTNVSAAGVPAEALEGVYGLHFFYWDLTDFPDSDVKQAGQQFVQNYQNEYGNPPDSYGTAAYIGTKELFRGVQLAGSTDADAISDALSKNPNFNSVKGPATWRVDHEPAYKYACDVVQGKAKADRKSTWDLLKVVGSYGGSDYLPPLAMLGY
jgi:branched-chain amino acid transport system substrate-binding protein